MYKIDSIGKLRSLTANGEARVSIPVLIEVWIFTKLLRNFISSFNLSSSILELRMTNTLVNNSTIVVAWLSINLHMQLGKLYWLLGHLEQVRPRFCSLQGHWPVLESQYWWYDPFRLHKHAAKLNQSVTATIRQYVIRRLVANQIWMCKSRLQKVEKARDAKCA